MNQADFNLAASMAKKQLLAKKASKQTEVEIFKNCQKKYQETENHLKQLMEKKRKLEEEISHLQQKQNDRLKFINDTRQRHQSN